MCSLFCFSALSLAQSNFLLHSMSVADFINDDSSKSSLNPKVLERFHYTQLFSQDYEKFVPIYIMQIKSLKLTRSSA